MDKSASDTPPTTDPVNQNSIRKRFVLIVPALLILLIVAVVIGMLFFSGSKPSEPSSSKKFPNLLTPTSEIKVGDSRYVSPCQVLPLAQASALFGKTKPGSQIIEDSLSASRPKTDDASDNIVRTHCGYELADKTVYLRADQYADLSELKQIGSVFLASTDKQAATIAALKTKTNSTNNQDAKALVATFEKSLATLNKYKYEYDEAALAKVNFNGMVLPAYASNNVQMLYNNVVYEIDSGININKASVDQMATIKKAFDIVKKHAANKQLDQSPAPTILGSSDHIGPTKILEPCVLVSTATFTKLTGQADNDLTSRITLPIDSNTDNIDKSVNKRVLPRNECERKYSAGDNGMSVSLSLYFGKSAAQAKQFVKDYDDDPTNAPQPLTTTADETYLFPNSLEPSTPLYLFRVGPYVGVIGYDTGRGDDSTRAGVEDHVRIINLLTELIRKQQ